MDGLWGHYAKWNKSDAERQILYDITHMGNWKKMKQTFEYNKKGADTDTENKLVVMSGMKESGGLRQEACNKKYKLLCKKWIMYKNILCNIRNKKPIFLKH